MPNQTLEAHNNAVIATVNAAELMHVDDADIDPEEEPLTSEQIKARMDLDNSLKRQGGKLQEKENCPECKSILALLPREGKMYQVCTEQFKDEPSCYWSRIQPKEGTETKPYSEEDMEEDEAREFSETPVPAEVSTEPEPDDSQVKKTKPAATKTARKSGVRKG